MLSIALVVLEVHNAPNKGVGIHMLTTSQRESMLHASKRHSPMDYPTVKPTLELAPHAGLGTSHMRNAKGT